jgi:hypothetical protein
MLERCKEQLFILYNAEEKKWLFLSAFDANKKLLVSTWTVETDRVLRTLIEDIYNQHIQPIIDQIHYIALDVVTDVVSFPEADQVFKLDPRVYGFVIEDLEDDNVGVILPNMAGVSDIKQVLYDVKKKYNIHGKAAISWFTTERILIAK